MVKPLKQASALNPPRGGAFSRHCNPLVRFVWEDILRRNVTVASVCESAGIDPASLHKWRRGSKGPFLSQIENVLEALGYGLKVVRIGDDTALMDQVIKLQAELNEAKATLAKQQLVMGLIDEYMEAIVRQADDQIESIAGMKHEMDKLRNLETV